MSEVLKSKAVNGWRLFWLVTAPISAAMLIAMVGKDLSAAESVSSMIQLSVRCAVPLLYVTFAASSVQTLFRGPLGGWLFRNRKYLGLCFAAAMGWQLFFILWLTTVHSDYYINEVYVLRDAIEGVVGYTFLIAMTVTSFAFARRRMKPKTWRLLHLSGIYFLWAYAFSVYWWALFYYKNPLLLDYIYYWSGFLAWALRVAAWNKKRRKIAEKSAPQSTTQPALNLAGILIIGVGLVAASFGKAWYDTAANLMTGYAITRIPETYLPYWPFEPWLPLFIIALGALLTTRARA